MSEELYSLTAGIGQSDCYDAIVPSHSLSVFVSMFFLPLTFWSIAAYLSISIPPMAESIHRRPSVHQSKIFLISRKIEYFLILFFSRQFSIGGTAKSFRRSPVVLDFVHQP
jgi:hypothetical protein